MRSYNQIIAIYFSFSTVYFPIKSAVKIQSFKLKFWFALVNGKKFPKINVPLGFLKNSKHKIRPLYEINAAPRIPWLSCLEILTHESPWQLDTRKYSLAIRQLNVTADFLCAACINSVFRGVSELKWTNFWVKDKPMLQPRSWPWFERGVGRHDF